MELGDHLGDLVEQQRAAGGGAEEAEALAHGAAEGAALVPEELALDELPREGCAVECDERAIAARADPVDRARHELLASPGLAHHEHGRRAGGDTLDLREYALHGIGSTNHPVEDARARRTCGVERKRPGIPAVVPASRHVVALGGNAHEAGGELVEQEDRGAQLERVIGKHSDAALLQQVHVRHDDREGETRRGNLRPEVARESEKGRPVPARQRFDRGAQPRDVGLAE